MDASPELVAMMLADARVPTGGHTQSGGLEAAVKAGLDGDVAGFSRDRLTSVVRVDAGTAVVARSLTLAGRSPRDVEAAWAARTPSSAVRDTSRRQGRVWLRMAERVWPAVLDHLPADTEVPRPVVMGVLGAVTGLSAEQVARLVAYDDVQTVAAASLKLLPVDPLDAAGWVAALQPEIERLVTDVSGLTTPNEIPAAGAPYLDVLAERHATERMRLFHA